MAIATAVLKVGSMLAKAGGAVAKGGKLAMKKGGTVLKKSKKLAGNVKKTIVKKKKIDKENFLSKDRTDKKKKEQDKRREEEERIEQTVIPVGGPSAEKSMSGGGGILQKLIGFISTIIIGWIVTNLPKIIESVKEVIQKIKDIFNNIKGFFSSFSEFFTKIKDGIGDTINKLKKIDLSKIGENIKKKISGIKDGFTNMIDKIKGGLNILRGKKNQDPKKLAESGFKDDASEKQNDANKDIAKSNSEIDSFSKETSNLSNENNELGGKLDDNLSKGEAELKKIGIQVDTKTDNGKNTINTGRLMGKVEKDGTGNEIINDSNESNNEKIKTQNELSGTGIKSDLSTITVDGKTYPKGRSGLGGYIPGGGEGGSTYKKLNNNDIISKSKTNTLDIAQNITPKTNNKEIVVDNIIKTNNTIHGEGGGESGLIVIENQQNNNVKENLLLDAAYT